MFYQHGYLETTLRDIAKKLGVTAPAFYSDISSKDELMVWICDDVCEKI